MDHAKSFSKKRQCTLCSKVLASSSSLNVHKRVHTKERPYQCQLCGNTFTQKSSLNTHMILHSGEKKFVCSFCGKHFALKIYKSTHEKTCKANPRHEIGGSHPSKGSYERNSHSGMSDVKIEYNNSFSFPAPESKPNLICLTPPASNIRYQYLISGPEKLLNLELPNHQQVLSPYPSLVVKPNKVKIEPYLSECPNLDLRNFEDYATKQDSSRYQCKLCGQMYAQKSSFKTHLILHSGLKNYHCDWCGKKFALKLYKTSHEKSCRKKYGQAQMPAPLPSSSLNSFRASNHLLQSASRSLINFPVVAPADMRPSPVQPIGVPSQQSIGRPKHRVQPFGKPSTTAEDYTHCC